MSSIGSSKTAKVLIGGLTGQLGGAYYGYQSAKNANEIALLQGKPANQSTTSPVIWGILLSPFSGMYYGAKCFDQEKQIETLQQQPTHRALPHQRSSLGMQQAPALQQQQWQERVTSTPAHSQARF